MPGNPDFLVEILTDGTALFHPQTPSAEAAVRSGRYGEDFFGGLYVEPTPSPWFGPEPREHHDILWEMIQNDGYKCEAKTH